MNHLVAVYAVLSEKSPRCGAKGCQDQKTGMWCQVVDKSTEPGNWNETSGTGMYIEGKDQACISKCGSDSKSYTLLVGGF